MLIEVLSPIHPQLEIRGNPHIRFQNGVAQVSAEAAEKLTAARIEKLGLIVVGSPSSRPSELEETPAKNGTSPKAEISQAKGNNPTLPSSRATVKQWVEFMAENGIEHPEDATKGEMSKIAITHFEGGAK